MFYLFCPTRRKSLRTFTRLFRIEQVKAQKKILSRSCVQVRKWRRNQEETCFRRRRKYLRQLNEEFFILAQCFAHFFDQVVSVTIKAIGKTNLVPSRHIKREKALLPVDARRSTTLTPFLELPARKRSLHLLTLLLGYYITVEPGLISFKLRGHSWDTVKWPLHGG